MLAANDITHTLSDPEFAARLNTLGAPRRYVVAVSGGADSMALAILAARHAQKTGVKVLCVTIDHQLREQSSSEAAGVSVWCEALGLSHTIKTWFGPKPTAGVQAAARHARYRLLYEAAEDWRAEAILTGHNADDQAETVFMRLSKGSGPRGLAGMKGRTLIAGGGGAPVALLRPLLDVPRQELRRFVEGIGQAFVDDPSNADPTYERVRVRRRLASLYENGALTREAILMSATAAGEACEALDQAEIDALKRANAVFWGWGGVCIDATLLDRSVFKTALCDGLMRQLFFAVGGQAAAPGRSAVARTLSTLREHAAATLGGAIARREGAHITIMREVAALTGRAGVPEVGAIKLPPGSRLLWDKRFSVENNSGKSVWVLPQAVVTPARPAHLAATPVFCNAHGAPVSAVERCFVNAKPLIEERFFRRVLRFE